MGNESLKNITHLKAEIKGFSETIAETRWFPSVYVLNSIILYKGNLCVAILHFYVASYT